jgi:hypothetical protein
MLARRRRTDVADVNLDRNHLVPEPTDDLGKQLKPKTSLIRDQYTQPRDVGLSHELPQNS